MTHLLDTNACIQMLRNPATSSVAQHLATTKLGSVGLCSIVKAELFYGAERSNHPEQGYNRLEHFLSPSIPCISMTGQSKRESKMDRSIYGT